MNPRFFGMILLAISILTLSSCGGVDPDKIEGWKVEVVLLELGPIPTKEEIRENRDILVGSRYRLISSTPLKLDGSALLLEEMVIFQKLATIGKLTVGGKGELKIHRWSDRTDLRNRFTKRKFEVADERPVFVVTDA